MIGLWTENDSRALFVRFLLVGDPRDRSDGYGAKSIARESVVGRVIAGVRLGLRPGEPTPRLYDAVVEALRLRHYPPSADWNRRCLAPSPFVGEGRGEGFRRQRSAEGGHRAGSFGAQGCPDYIDLHPRVESRWSRSPQPGGYFAPARRVIG
jgi:hypothetical protein